MAVVHVLLVKNTQQRRAECSNVWWNFDQQSATPTRAKGTMSLENKVGNVKVGFTSSNNERDLFGIRDNGFVFGGTPANSVETQTRDGISVGTGIVGFSEQTVTSTNNYTGEVKVSEPVQEINVGPVAINSSGEQKIQFSQKRGIGYGYEMAGSLNLSNNRPDIMTPPSMYNNRVDNTTSGKAPPVNLPKIVPLVAPAPKKETPTFNFRPF